MNDPSADRGKYLTGVRGMKGAPMGKSVFRLMRAAHPDLSNIAHQKPLQNYGHDALPFGQASPIPPNTGVGK